MIVSLNNEFEQAAQRSSAAAASAGPAPRELIATRPAAPPSPNPHRKELLEAARDTATARKAQSRYMEDQIASERAEASHGVEPTVRWDVALLRKAAWKLINIYEMVTSFIGYHLCGVMTLRGWNRRAAFCVRCTFRKRRHSATRPAEPVQIGTPLDWRDKCHGPGKGKPCGCPSDLSWKPAALIWKLWLRLFGCPLGHWDRGGYVPDPPDGDGAVSVDVKSCTGCGG